jgi:hypothetical protein
LKRNDHIPAAATNVGDATPNQKYLAAAASKRLARGSLPTAD